MYTIHILIVAIGPIIMKHFYKGYSLDRIKMTEWIWPNHDNDKLYFLNFTKIETDKPYETDKP